MRSEIGRGVLTWTRGERISDRYGTVFLMAEGSNSLTKGAVQYRPLARVDGIGKLVAEVTETRQSTHIGDLFRGLFPPPTKVGDRIELGQGEVFYETYGDEGITVIGLKPDDGRDHDWLDPRALYRAHEQSVILTFEEEER